MNKPLRYFVTFKPNTSLYDKVMVFTDTTLQDAWDSVVREYTLAVDKILPEPEMAHRLPNVYNSTNQIVPFGTECIVYKKDMITGGASKDILATYPVHNLNHVFEEKKV